jgi:membrane-associated phospholipid phosphatase
MNVQDKLDPLAERLLDFDGAAREVFAGVEDSAVAGPLHLFSKLGDQPELRTISGALVIAGTFGGSDRLVRAGTRMIIAHELATFAKDLIKTDIDRKRPRSAKKRDEKKPRPGNHQSKEITSFPSGHSAGAIAAARAFSREFPEYGAAAITAATLVAASQVPRRAHYPTDVAAGLALGLAAEKLVDIAWGWLGMEERTETR